MQENKVAVAFYYGLRKNDYIIDQLTQSALPYSWVPAIANIQENNISRLMEMANISPTDWKNFLVETFKFDPTNPTEAGLRNATVNENGIDYAMEIALEQMENWELSSDINDLWPFNPDTPKNLSPAQVYEIIQETHGRGTPVIGFQADEDVIMSALSEDNLITLKPTGNSVFIGLSDPINGISWSPESISSEINFRPSLEGLTVLGDEAIFKHLIDEVYVVDVEFKPGELLRLSTASEDMSRLNAPAVRDERQGPKMNM